MILAPAYWILYRVAWIFTNLFKSFFPKVKKGFELRKTKDGVKPWLNFPKGTNPIWIHAPSGEFEYAVPVIREIKERNPQTKILVTYYTPSYIGRISKEPLVDFYCPTPWDTASAFSEFIQHHQPQQLLIARTGFWPEMLRQCKRHGIPTLAFSMTFNKRVTTLTAFFFRWLFKKVDRFFVVAQEDKDSLIQIDPRYSVDVLGDTRYDQCLFRLREPTPLKIVRDILPKKVFVCASTWPEDEAVVLPYVRDHIADAHWIVVPHETDKAHIENIKKQLSPIPTTLYSEIQTWNGDGVLIVDTFGVLAALYKIADGAFIGASFKSRVHSVMESLACGNITFVGPYHTNNREALEFLKFKGTTVSPVQIITGPSDTSVILKNLNTWTAADKNVLQKAFVNKSGVSRRLVDLIGVRKT